jgi:hypothetical protein
VIDTVVLPCDDVILAIGRRTRSLDRARHRHRLRCEATCRSSTRRRCSRAPGVFFGGDAAWGPRNIIWAWSTGTKPRSRSTITARRIAHRSSALGMNLVSAKSGCTRGATATTTARAAHEDAARRADEALRGLNVEVELGFTASRQRAKSSAASTATSRRTSLPPLHRVRRLHRRMSRELLTIAPDTGDDSTCVHISPRRR